MPPGSTTTTTIAPSPGVDILSNPGSAAVAAGDVNPTSTGNKVAVAAPTSASTFPGSDTASANGLPAPPQMSVAAFTAFASQHGVSPTEMANYIDTTTGSLTGWATEFLNYYQSNSESRQAIQDQLVDADLLAQSAANGLISSTTNTAFNTAMSTAVKQGVPLNQYLAAAAGPGQTQQLIAKQAAAAETMQATETPTTFSYTDPNTLTAGLASAFEAAVGHAPTAAQTATFISQFHAQEASDAASYKQSYVATANADQAQIQKETAALDNLPATELDKFVSAYRQAIGSSNNPVGPQVAGAPSPASTGQYLTPGSKLPPNTVAGFNPSGTEMVANVPSTSKTTTEQVPPGGVAQLEHAGSSLLHLINPLSGWSNSAAKSDITGLTGAGTPYTSRQVTTTTPGKGMATAPNIPAGAPGTSVVHGGEWAISPLLWQEAQQLLPKTKLPSTPAQASVAMQQAAFTALAQYYEQQTGSWTDTATILASGNPNATPATAGNQATTGKPGTHIDNFTTNIVNQTNAALTALQNEATAGPAAETIGKEAPNATDDELAAAKASDPSGYYANQMSMYEGLLNQLLYGTPISEDTRQSNIQGPVLSDSGPQAGPPGPVAAPGPASAPATAAV